MPEGDAVLRTARRLDAALTGRRLAETDFRVPALATVDLSGAVVVGSLARGKHLLTRIDASDRAWTLHTHLKMEGSWRLLHPGQRWPRPAHEARVVLRTRAERAPTGQDLPAVEAVGFRLGIVELLRRDHEATAVGHLGPDVLGDDWSTQAAVRRLLTTDRPVFEAIRDQELVAGIGTIYASEACFVTGTAPSRPVGEVDDLPRLLERARELMQHEWSRTGRMWVYGRRSCRRCGGPVRRDRFAVPGAGRRHDVRVEAMGQAAYWCPRCQPAD